MKIIRCFLAIAALAVALRVSAPAAPDILLVMPDQMRGDCLSLLGHPAVRTPNFDKLTQAGTLFRRAYSTVPSCIPARYALLTGLQPQTSGVVGFKSRPMTTPTLPALLGGVGYATVLVGRNMHQAPENRTVGFQREVLGSTYVDGDAYDQYLKQVSPDTGGIRKLVQGLGLDFNLWPAQPWPLPDDQHPTAWIVRQSQQIVAETPAQQPLFLVASFYAPHPPLFPPKQCFDALRQRKLPPAAHGDWEDWSSLSTNGDRAGHRIRLEGETLARAQAGYFGLIEQLDEAIAPLLAAFQARSEKAGRPWVVILTSDHGELLGDHGYFRKCEPYEGSANIPFIVAGSPGLGFKAGQRCLQPVCLEDILPTMLALAGTNAPAGTDGVNLLPTLRGQDQHIRDVLHFEHAPCYSKAQAFHALTDGRFKYLWRPEDGTEQLFDLVADPHEEHDLAPVAAENSRLLRWRGQLIQRLAHRPEGFTDGKRLIPGSAYPAIMKGKS